MNMTDVMRKIERIARENSPTILTALGVSGSITTAYLTGRAAYASASIIQAEEELDVERVLTVVDKTKLVWKLYIPAGLSGLATVAMIVSASRVGSRRTAAITAAYSISEKAFVEYQEKVIETLGEKKEQAVRDQIAQDRITNNPVANSTVVMTANGNVLCCELYTGRYFNSDMETLRKAENELNARLLREMYATLSDWYSLIGIPYTANSCDIGWDSDRLMQLKYSTVLSDDGRPCIAFDYNYTKPMYSGKQ